MSAVLLHAGQARALIGAAQISADDGSALWSGDVTLAHAEDYARVALGDAVVLRAYGVDYALVVVGKRRARGLPPSYTLTCQSPAALLDAPWAGPVRLAPTGQARAVVERLLGQPVAWELVDWALPGAAAAEEGTPLALARRICAAAGGRLESLPDGSLRARAAYPVSPPDWPHAAVGATLTDRELLAHDESADAPQIANRLTILSGATSAAQVQVESSPEAADPQQAVVRAYPQPWRALTLAHTGDAHTAIGARREMVTQHDELLAIVNGEATTRYPVYDVVSSQWVYKDLGPVDIDGTAVRSRGGPDDYGQLRLIYTARCWSWSVQDPRAGSIQFLVLEDV